MFAVIAQLLLIFLYTEQTVFDERNVVKCLFESGISGHPACSSLVRVGLELDSFPNLQFRNENIMQFDCTRCEAFE